MQSPTRKVVTGKMFFLVFRIETFYVSCDILMFRSKLIWEVNTKITHGYNTQKNQNLHENM